MPINRTQPMRPAEIEMADLLDAYTAQVLPDGAVTTGMLADLAVTTDKIADGAVTTDKLASGSVDNTALAQRSVNMAKLSTPIQNMLSFLQTVPSLEFGTSNSVDVPANSNTSVDVTFGSTKTEAPVVLCGVQHATAHLTCMVTATTNQQFSVTVYNDTSTDATGATVDYLAISGR